MRTPGVATQGKRGESYPDFTKRITRYNKRVAAKCAALDACVPFCRSCGETCEQTEAGTRCKQNNMAMTSRWAREVAQREFYRLGHFGGSWSNEVENLACLLDRVRSRAEDTTPASREARHAR